MRGKKTSLTNPSGHLALEVFSEALYGTLCILALFGHLHSLLLREGFQEKKAGLLEGPEAHLSLSNLQTSLILNLLGLSKVGEGLDPALSRAHTNTHTGRAARPDPPAPGTASDADTPQPQHCPPGHSPPLLPVVVCI